jgi:hypothetical protein
MKCNTKGKALNSPASSAPTVAAQVETNSIQTADQDGPLNTADKELLNHLEDTIRKGFKVFDGVNEAFGIIHDKRLYREQYGTFAEYCQTVWGMSRSKGQRYLAFIKCVKNLKCSQLATNEELAIPANEAQVRRMATLEPKQQVEVAKQVAKRTGRPTARDFDEEAEAFTEDKPRVQSCDIRVEAGAALEKQAEVQSVSPAVSMMPNTALVTHKELHQQSVDAYNISSDSAKRKDLEKILWKLKAGLQGWSDWEAKQLNEKEAV